MSENGVNKTVAQDGTITLERDHIDVNINDLKTPLFSDFSEQHIPHVIYENGGVFRAGDRYSQPILGTLVPDSNIISGAIFAENTIYGGFTSFVYDEQTFEPTQRATQAIWGGNKNDIIHADLFKGSVDIPTVSLKSENAPNGIKEVQSGDNNIVFAEEGNDLVTAGHGENAIFAGEGADTVVVGDGDNFISTGNDTDIDTVSTGTGLTAIMMGGEDRIIANGGFITATVESDTESENLITVNKPSAIFLDDSHMSNLVFGDEGFGYVNYTNSDYVKINLDEQNYSLITLDFTKPTEDTLEFTMYGTNPDSPEIAELGSGFVENVETIALEYGTKDNDPENSLVEINVPSLVVGQQSQLSIDR